MTEPTLDVLLQHACDRDAELGSRDDAVGELRYYDSPDVIEVLLRLARDESEDDLIQAQAGESLGEIWVRTGTFLPPLLESLTPTAKAEVARVCRRLRPDWLISVQDSGRT